MPRLFVQHSIKNSITKYFIITDDIITTCCPNFFAKKHPQFKSTHHELSKQESPADAKVSERDLQQSLLYL